MPVKSLRYFNLITQFAPGIGEVTLILRHRNTLLLRTRAKTCFDFWRRFYRLIFRFFCIAYCLSAFLPDSDRP